MASIEKLQPEERIAAGIHAASIHLLRGLRRVDALSGLNGPRLSALSVIVFRGPITLGDLAEAEQVRPPTMTRIVHALEEQGLVTKHRDETDRRSIGISATIAGKKQLIAGRNRRTKALAAKIANLDPKDQATLQRAAMLMNNLAG